MSGSSLRINSSSIPAAASGSTAAVAFHENGPIRAHRQAGAKLLLALVAANRDGDHLACFAPLAHAQRFLQSDLVERVDAHLQTLDGHTAAIRPDAHTDVVVHNALERNHYLAHLFSGFLRAEQEEANSNPFAAARRPVVQPAQCASADAAESVLGMLCIGRRGAGLCVTARRRLDYCAELLEGNHMYGAEGDLGHTIWLILHLVLFAYWLGGDIGVFYSTRMVLNRSFSAPQRFMASRIMLWIDLLPRLCLSMMLTVGGILSEYVGVSHPPWQMAAIVLLGPVWFTVLLIMHFKHNASFMPTLTKLDLWFPLVFDRRDCRFRLLFGLHRAAGQRDLDCTQADRFRDHGALRGDDSDIHPRLHRRRQSAQSRFDHRGAGRRHEAQHLARAPMGFYDLGRLVGRSFPGHLQAGCAGGGNRGHSAARYSGLCRSVVRLGYAIGPDPRA